MAKRGRSILLGRGQARRSPLAVVAFGLGQHPDDDTLQRAVGREQPAAVEEGLVVRLLILGIDFAPIAAQVLVEKEPGILAALGKGFNGPRGSRLNALDVDGRGEPDAPAKRLYGTVLRSGSSE